MLAEIKTDSPFSNNEYVQVFKYLHDIVLIFCLLFKAWGVSLLFMLGNCYRLKGIDLC